MTQYIVKEVLKELKKNGFKETRITGDHHRFEDQDGHKVTVPYKSLKDILAPKTYQSIKKTNDQPVIVIINRSMTDINKTTKK